MPLSLTTVFFSTLPSIRSICCFRVQRKNGLGIAAATDAPAPARTSHAAGDLLHATCSNPHSIYLHTSRAIQLSHSKLRKHPRICAMRVPPESRAKIKFSCLIWVCPSSPFFILATVACRCVVRDRTLRTSTQWPSVQVNLPLRKPDVDVRSYVPSLRF